MSDPTPMPSSQSPASDFTVREKALRDEIRKADEGVQDLRLQLQRVKSARMLERTAFIIVAAMTIAFLGYTNFESIPDKVKEKVDRDVPIAVETALAEKRLAIDEAVDGIEASLKAAIEDGVELEKILKRHQAGTVSARVVEIINENGAVIARLGEADGDRQVASAHDLIDRIYQLEKEVASHVVSFSLAHNTDGQYRDYGASATEFAPPIQIDCKRGDIVRVRADATGSVENGQGILFLSFVGPDGVSEPSITTAAADRFGSRRDWMLGIDCSVSPVAYFKATREGKYEARSHFAGYQKSVRARLENGVVELARVR